MDDFGLIDPDRIEDLALDFIEQVVGRIDFKQNGSVMSNKKERIDKWLRDLQEPLEYGSFILRQIDEYHARPEFRYDNPFETFDWLNDNGLLQPKKTKLGRRS